MAEGGLGLTARPRRRPTREGFGMVEFALVAPLALLLLMGLVVLGVVVTDQVQITNAVRDGVRAAAVCGANPTGTTTLPDGTTPCTDPTPGNNPDGNLIAYITNLANGSHGGVAAPTITVFDTTRAQVGTSMSACRKGYTVEVSTSFAQPLFIPLVGHWLGDNGGGTRTITATADATCEQ
jgi:Flp pilus assembly protein TadG